MPLLGACPGTVNSGAVCGIRIAARKGGESDRLPRPGKTEGTKAGEKQLLRAQIGSKEINKEKILKTNAARKPRAQSS